MDAVEDCDDSDIDVVMILDSLRIGDLDAYKETIARFSVFFVLRADQFCKSGVFVKRKSDLMVLLKEEARCIFETNAEDFSLLSEKLLHWSSRLIREYGSAR